MDGPGNNNGPGDESGTDPGIDSENAPPMAAYMTVLKPSRRQSRRQPGNRRSSGTAEEPARTNEASNDQDRDGENEIDDENLRTEMKVPPPKDFDTSEQLLQYVREFGLSQGYVATIRTSNRDKNMYIGCDRSGSARERIAGPERVRQRKLSRRNGCPFLLYARRTKRGKWTFTAREDRHNHAPDMEATRHPLARRLTDRQFDIVRQHVLFGSPPRVILADLREQFADIQVTSRDIYNAKAHIEARLHQERAANGSPQYLGEYMETNGWLHDVLHDDAGHIQGLFFAHQRSLDLARRHCLVYLVDVVSKTNRQDMPMAHFVGTTSAGSVFSAAFCFVRAVDDAGALAWALDSFKTHVALAPSRSLPVLATDRSQPLADACRDVLPTWPRIICPWFATSDVRAVARQALEDSARFRRFMRDFTALVHSPTPTDFASLWDTMQRDYSVDAGGVSALTHVASQWLPLKELFATAYLGPYARAASMSASAVENARSYVRGHLVSSTADLRQAFRNIEAAVAEQHRRIQSSTGELLAALHHMDSEFAEHRAS